MTEEPMSAVWIVLVAVAVVAVIAIVALRRREPKSGPEALSPPDGAGVRIGGGEGAAVRMQPSRAADEEARREAPPEPAAQAVEAAGAERDEPVASSVTASSATDLPSHVHTLLEDSGRMLGQLRATSEAGGKTPATAGTVEILEEGLEEIRALVKRKEWSQAREKGEALRAQLSLMLPSSPGKKAS